MLLGALYLFIINAYFIFSSSVLVLSLLGIPKVREMTEAKWKSKQRKMIRNTIFVLIPCIAAIISIYLS